MGKYIDADKLKVDIKKRYDEMLNRAKIDANNAEYWNGKADSYRAIYDLIDSLQQEQPEVNLEEAITDYYGRMPDDEDKIVAARHFYELGLKSK